MVHRRVPWVRVDGRAYVDAMTLEVLLRDAALELEKDEEHRATRYVLQLADSLAAIPGPIVAEERGEMTHGE